MPKLEPMAIFMFMIDTAIVVLFILFTLAIFFSVRTVVHNDDARRSSMEMSDVMANLEIAPGMNVFSMEKLNEVEKTGLELYARGCEFGFVVEIEEVGAKTECSTGNDCTAFCASVCGSGDMSKFGTLTGDCGCNFELFGANYCQCKKSDDIWHNGYYWKFGSMPVLTEPTTKTTQEFPSGIAITSGKYGAALPAKMTVTAYDSFLTRASCVALKSYGTKEINSFSFSASQIPVLPGYVTLGKKDDKICIYTENAEDCRHIDVPLAEDINMAGVLETIEKSGKGVLTAYPLKAGATCDDVKNSDALSKPGDDSPVENVLLCVKAVE